MSAKNRADLIAKLHKFVKKEFQVIAAPSNRSVLDHLVYGCCLENSTHEAADEAFAKLQENFFDWNEVRVTTVEELAETAKSVAHPLETALSLKKTLHGVFEHYYQFDLDFLRKENLSKAVQTFEKFRGVSPFVVSHVAQNGLGGHSIPLDRAMLELFYVLGIISESEMRQGRVPGLERTIPKAKGIEFFNLVHQLAVAFENSPFSNNTRDKLVKINAEAKERFPKRGQKVGTVVEPPAKAPAKADAEAAKKPAKKSTKKSDTTEKAAPKKANAAKSTASKTKSASKSASKSAGTKSTAKATSAKSAKAGKKSKVTKAAKPPAKKKKVTKRPASKPIAKKKTTKKPAVKKTTKRPAKKTAKRKPR